MTHSLTSSDIKQFQSYLMDSNVKLNTAKKYVRDVKKLAHFLSDQTQTLSQNSLDAFLKSLPEAGYEARSINSIIASIKSYCKFAGRTDLQCKSLNIRKRSNHAEPEETACTKSFLGYISLVSFPVKNRFVNNAK